MSSLRFRSVTAAALALWLGGLSCVLGCAMPSDASPALPEMQVSRSSAAPCPDPGVETGELCCRHGHHPANGSGKSGHRSISCCPSETALIQKQNVASPVFADSSVALPVMGTFRAPSFVFANADAYPLMPGPSGRDILLQMHVLRI